MTGELEQIREEYLIVKNFSCPKALIDLGPPECYGRWYLRISVEVNSKSQVYKVLHSEIVWMKCLCCFMVEFQDNVSFGLRVFGFVDDAYTALPDLLGNSVVEDCPTY